jgi:DNA repair protein RecN (Recombination protein N)
LAQVAVCAEHHFNVSKAKQQVAGKDAGVSSVIEKLEPADRVQAIAQLLGGVEITDTTRKHAKELLQNAR